MNRIKKMSPTKRIALSALMCALATALMSLGGFIPLATYIAPSLAGLCLLPIFVECSEKTAYCAWAATALLALLLCPDKEAALLYLFLGYYPILRWRMARIQSLWLRIAAKLALFNLAVCAMYALALFALGMQELMQEYRELGLMMSLIMLLLGNVTLLLYDRLIVRGAALYLRRLRGKLL